MDILLNGIATPIPDCCTVSGLLAHLDLAQRKVAVEINGTIVPRGAHERHALRDGDRVEVVHALGGG